MVDYIIIAVAAISLLFVVLLTINNRKQRSEIRNYQRKIEELQRDSTDYLNFYD